MLEQHEQISALMDGELRAEEDIQRVVIHMQQDDKMRLCWERYHLIGDTLKKNLPDSLERNLANSVAQALQSLPPLSVPAYRDPASFPFKYKSLTGFALAASAGIIAFLGVSALEPQTSPLQAQFLSSVGGAPIRTVNPLSSPLLTQSAASFQVQGAHWDVAHPAVESKLNDYLATHEFSASSSAPHRGMPPYVRIIGYEPSKP